MLPFKEIFAAKKLNNKKVLSFEFFPPKKEELLPATEALILDLASLNPDFMTVTYGAGGGTREYTKRLVSFITEKTNVPAVSHLTCVGHTKSEISNILKQLKEVGVSHILALRGDLAAGQTHFTPEEDGFSCARDLASFVKSEGDFSVAVAAYPEGHRDAKSKEEEFAYLLEKSKVPSECILTQIFFDPEIFINFCKDAQETGIDIPIMPGIMPVQGVSQLERFTAMCGSSIPAEMLAELKKVEQDKEKVIEYGTQYAIKQIKTLFEAGAPGVHLYTLNKSEQIKKMVESFSSYF
jgi:methylenetetrahydrofolate reductase (NADPH)